MYLYEFMTKAFYRCSRILPSKSIVTLKTQLQQRFQSTSVVKPEIEIYAQNE